MLLRPHARQSAVLLLLTLMALFILLISAVSWAANNDEVGQLQFISDLSATMNLSPRKNILELKTDVKPVSSSVRVARINALFDAVESPSIRPEAERDAIQALNEVMSAEGDAPAQEAFIDRALKTNWSFGERDIRPLLQALERAPIRDAAVLAARNSALDRALGSGRGEVRDEARRIRDKVPLTDRARKILDTAPAGDGAKASLTKWLPEIRTETQLTAFNEALSFLQNHNLKASPNLVKFIQLSAQIQNESQAKLYTGLMKDSMWSKADAVAAGILRSQKYFLKVQNPYQAQAYEKIIGIANWNFDTSENASPTLDVHYLTPEHLDQIPSAFWTAGANLKSQSDFDAFSKAVAGNTDIRVFQQRLTATRNLNALNPTNPDSTKNPKTITERAQEALNVSLITGSAKDQLHGWLPEIKTETQLGAFLDAVESLHNKISSSTPNLVKFVELSSQIQNESQAKLYTGLMKESMWSKADSVAGGILRSGQYFLKIQNPFQAAAYETIIGLANRDAHNKSAQPLDVRYLTVDRLERIPQIVWNASLKVNSQADLDAFHGAISASGDISSFQYRLSTVRKLSALDPTTPGAARHPKTITERAQQALDASVMKAPIKTALRGWLPEMKTETQLAAFLSALENLHDKITASTPDLTTFVKLSSQIQNESQAQIFRGLMKDSMGHEANTVASGILRSQQYFLKVQNPYQAQAYEQIIGIANKTAGNTRARSLDVHFLTPEQIGDVPQSFWNVALNVHNQSDLDHFTAATAGSHDTEDFQYRLSSIHKLNSLDPLVPETLKNPRTVSERAREALNASLIAGTTKDQLQAWLSEMKTETQLGAFTDALKYLHTKASSSPSVAQFMQLSSQIQNESQRNLYRGLMRDSMDAETVTNGILRSKQYFLKVQNPYQAQAYENIIGLANKQAGNDRARPLDVYHLTPEQLDSIPQSVWNAALSVQSQSELEAFNQSIGSRDNASVDRSLDRSRSESSGLKTSLACMIEYVKNKARR